MSFFPFMQDVEGKCFLVVGDGEIAQRKIRFLQQFTADIRIVRHFQAEDLSGADFCIASSDDREENGRIAALCREAGIPVNVPDDPSACTFYLPAVVKRGDLVIAVSTGGQSPAFARAIRRRVEETLPDRTEEILDRMAELRGWVPRIMERSKDRAEVYTEILRMLMEGELQPSEERVRQTAMDLIKRLQ